MPSRPASSLTLSGGTLNLGGFANTAGTLVMQNGLITGNGTFAAASFNLQNGTLAGSLVGSGSLSMTTSGTVTITSSNNYSGGTMLSGGTLVVSADNNLGAATGALTLDGGTLEVLGTSFSSTTRPVTTTSNGGAISVADPNNTLTLATQNLSGSGAFTKAGQGALQLGGSIASSAITVQDGILQLTGSASQLAGNPALNLWNVATFSACEQQRVRIRDQSHRRNDQHRLGHAEPDRQSELRPLDLAGDHSGQPVAGNRGGRVLRQSRKLDRLDGRGEYLRQSGRRPGENGKWTAAAHRIEPYSGGTTIAAGVLMANDGTGLQSSSPLTFNSSIANGGVLQMPVRRPSRAPSAPAQATSAGSAAAVFPPMAAC